MRSYSCFGLGRKEAKQIAFLSSLLKTIAEENRLRLLCILRQGRYCVCELIEQTKMSQSLISHHLKDLKEAGVVIDEKQGLRVYYQLTDKGKQVTDLLFSIPQKEVEL